MTSTEQPLRVLSIWTVYDHPKDYNDAFVARKFLNDKPTDDILLAPTLEELRKAVQKAADYELLRMERSECDDPFIVESWL